MSNAVLQELTKAISLDRYVQSTILYSLTVIMQLKVAIIALCFAIVPSVIAVPQLLPLDSVCEWVQVG